MKSPYAGKYIALKWYDNCPCLLCGYDLSRGHTAHYCDYNGHMINYEGNVISVFCASCSTGKTCTTKIQLEKDALDYIREYIERKLSNYEYAPYGFAIADGTFTCIDCFGDTHLDFYKNILTHGGVEHLDALFPIYPEIGELLDDLSISFTPFPQDFLRDGARCKTCNNQIFEPIEEDNEP